MMGPGSDVRSNRSTTGWRGIGEVPSGGVHLVLGSETALRTVAARGVGVGAVNAQCVAAGGLAWSAVREGQCVEAMLEPTHANLFEASVLPAVHVLTNHRVEIGIGLPEQRYIALVAGCGAQGIGVIAASGSVVGVGLQVPNNNIGVAACQEALRSRFRQKSCWLLGRIQSRPIDRGR